MISIMKFHTDEKYDLSIGVSPIDKNIVAFLSPVFCLILIVPLSHKGDTPTHRLH